MIRRAAVLLAVVALGAAALGPVPATADDSVFSRTRSTELRGSHIRVQSDDYLQVRTDLARARAVLRTAPESAQVDDGAAPLSFDLPRPDGTVETFAVRETSVMAPALAASQPQVHTYVGESVETAGTTLALDVTQMGLHASVREADGNDWFLDPAYDRPGTDLTVSYYTSSVDLGQDTHLLEPETLRDSLTSRAGAARAATGRKVVQHVYRLALANDPTYAAYFGAANVDAEKATLINRVNQIYNDDLGIKLQLVAGNNLLNFATAAEAYEPDGPCGGPACWERAIDLPGEANDEPDQLAACGFDTLGRNTAVIGQILGSDSYDVGHIVLGTDGGGLADLGVVGWSRKGDGCTGLPRPTGDYMAIDYVAHELGHEFGANHTFSGTDVNCGGGNRAGGSSVEPGSGSSVMAYAGICGDDDLQKHSDPYFSQRSLTEINSYIANPVKDSVEIQSVALSGVGHGDTITIGHPGSPTTVDLVAGSTYTTANVASAISTVTGVATRKMIVTGWGFDPWGNFWPDEPETDVDLHGFQVMFTPNKDPDNWPEHTTDLDNLAVTVSDGTAEVAEVSTGGPVSAAGHRVVTDNTRPTITAPDGFAVPTRTPFVLKAKAHDADGDPYVVLWEQNDRGPGGRTPNSLFSQDKTSGPLFRIFGSRALVADHGALTFNSPGQNHAGSAGIRVFPNMGQVLSNNTNAVTGRCPTHRGRSARIDCLSEFLPTASYRGGVGGALGRMHFRATVRDRNPSAGGVAHDDTVVRVARGTGPFLVTSQASGGVFKRGARIRVTWQVNRTDRLSGRVRIFVMGLSGERIKVGATRNDGRTTVTLPRTAMTRARIMVMAQNAPWFDLNRRSFEIR